MHNNIKLYRNEAGYSQQELASFLGISREHLLRIENEKHQPSLELAFEICKIFSCKIENMFFF